MAGPAQPLIRPKQINLTEWPNPRDHINYVQLVKALSAAGFAWTRDDFAWHRARDNAAFADEALEDLVRCHPTLVPAAVKVIQHGASGFKIDIKEQDDGSWTTTLTPAFNAIDALAGLA